MIHNLLLLYLKKVHNKKIISQYKLYINLLFKSLNCLNKLMLDEALHIEE